MTSLSAKLPALFANPQIQNSSTSSASSTSNNNITVTSTLLNGTTITGFYIDLRVNGTHLESGYTPVTFSNLMPGVTYGVVAYWADNYYFRHFSNGNLNRYQLLSLNGSSPVTLNAMYEYVPTSKAATLNILAEFPNGTLIGKSYDLNGSFYHTPGMWIQVVPPGQTTPYTGTFTGGSVLPFVFFNHQTYTVEMALGYGNILFSHWQDNNSTNSTRPIKTNG